MTPVPSPITPLEFLDLQALQVFAEGVANERGTVRPDPLSGPIGGTKQRLVQDNLYHVHMLIMIHNDFNSQDAGPGGCSLPLALRQQQGVYWSCRSGRVTWQTDELSSRKARWTS